MLEGFQDHDVEVDGTRVHARVAGEGPPLLLLHGYPQTHVMWHRVAPGLAERRTVVLADLRGYGDSARPASTADHASYSKRAMATDQVGLMRDLGFGTFALVGHDRGARVAHRLCLDHPQAVSRVALLDIVPTRHVFAHVDLALAQAYEHWFFLSQEPDLPERLIGADPGYYLRHKLAQWSSGAGATDFAPEAVEEYVRCFSDPAAIHASCEDYRAGAGVDDQHDAADLGRRRIACPVLALWGTEGIARRAEDPLAAWRPWCDDLRGHGIPGGHFLPEESPAQTLDALEAFFTEGLRG